MRYLVLGTWYKNASHNFWTVPTCRNWNHKLSVCTSLNYNKGGYTLVTLPRIVTPYRDSVDGTRDRVTYQKLVTR